MKGVRAFVFVPAVDGAVHQHEVFQRAFFEGGGDVLDGALRRQDGADHAFAGVPFGAGEVGEVGAGVDVDGGDALRLHVGLRARDALQVFVFADRDGARRHVREGGQRLVDGLTADTDSHFYIPLVCARIARLSPR